MNHAPRFDRAQFELEAMVVAELAKKLMPDAAPGRSAEPAKMPVYGVLKVTNSGRLWTLLESPEGAPKAVHDVFLKHWLFLAGDFELFPLESLHVGQDLHEKVGLPLGWIVVFRDDPALLIRVNSGRRVVVSAERRH